MNELLEKFRDPVIKEALTHGILCNFTDEEYDKAVSEWINSTHGWETFQWILFQTARSRKP